MRETYSISCRGLTYERPIQNYLEKMLEHLNINSGQNVSLSQVDSVFGNVSEHSTLYGGRFVNEINFSDEDLQWLHEQKIGLKIPLSSTFITKKEYKQSFDLLEKYHYKNKQLCPI